MKKIILSAALVVTTSFLSFGQFGNGNAPAGNANGNNGNGNSNGIGSATNPYDQLYIKNHVKVGTNSIWLDAASPNTSTTPDNRLFTTTGPLKINGEWPASGPVPQSLGFNTLINPDGGNVGIGTLTPTSKLHIHNGHMRITGTNAFGGPMLLFGSNGQANDNGQWGIEYVPAANGNPGLNFWRPWPNVNNGNYFLFLANNGNIGIGTNDPKGYKLAVKGRMIAEEVVVKLYANWPDFVFAKEYGLMPLEEVENFIDENSHLPNVPSAVEVEEKGISLGEMDAKLLQKIEELTLYVIELKKEIDELKK